MVVTLRSLIFSVAQRTRGPVRRVRASPFLHHFHHECRAEARSQREVGTGTGQPLAFCWRGGILLLNNPDEVRRTRSRQDDAMESHRYVLDIADRSWIA
jgi:hypothetical protein